MRGGKRNNLACALFFSAYWCSWNIIIVHLSTAFFKIVCGILEFLDRATRNCRPHSMLFRFILLFVWDMSEIGFIRPRQKKKRTFQSMSIAKACRSSDMLWATCFQHPWKHVAKTRHAFYDMLSKHVAVLSNILYLKVLCTFSLYTDLY